MQPHRPANLDSIPADAFCQILPYLCFPDILRMRAVCRELEQRLSQCHLTMPNDRSKVCLSKFDGHMVLQLGGTTKRLRYAGGCAPRVARLFGTIHTEELRIIVEDSDLETLDFYEEVAAKCDFKLLHLTVAQATPRIEQLIRAHADKDLQLVFRTADSVDLDILRRIQRPALIYFCQTMSLGIEMILDLIANGHTLEMVRSQAMSMLLVRQISEMLSVSATPQLVSVDVPLALFDAHFHPSRPLGTEGGDWICEGSAKDKLTVHRKWRRGAVRLTESRRRTENDEWYMEAPVETRLVLANCDRQSIAGVIYPHACPPDEPETIAEELQELGARAIFSVRRYFGLR